MKRVKFLIFTFSCGLSISASASLYSTNAAAAQQYDQKTLGQVQALYGLSEDAAVTRLAKEYDAAVLSRRIEGQHLPGYAGSWFDAETQSLFVATNNRDEFIIIERVGATPVLVKHSLKELDAARQFIANTLSVEVGGGSVRQSYVDVQANGVVLGVIQRAVARASAFVAAANVVVPVRLVPMAANQVNFSTDLRAADGTQNHTWTIPPPYGVHPCSVGASSEEVIGSSYVAGFATAGHCGADGNEFYTSDGTSTDVGTDLGAVEASTFSYTDVTDFNTWVFASHEDGAWFETLSGWVPKPQINGYSDGILNVSGTWSGMLTAPVGTTVCRYGMKSGGPHCATVSALNVTYDFLNPDPNQVALINGLIKVNGICTNDGDSGGPLITPAGQVQGTDSGGTASNSCPDDTSDTTFYQPIVTTIATAGQSLTHPVAMLTSHGRSAPTVAGMHCPDMANSGNYVYICDFSSFDSQGATTISWTTNTGASSDSTELSSHCSHGQTVNVALAVSNPYGTINGNASFTCPSRPAP